VLSCSVVLRWIALAAAAASLAGCPRYGGGGVYVSNDAGRPDTGENSRDTDGDGLCDYDEGQVGTRSDHADTDLDAFSDLVEVSVGSDPLSAASPDRESVVYLDGAEGETVRATIQIVVEGGGEHYDGAFRPIPQLVEDGLDAQDFYASARAVAAAPASNVAGYDESGQRFLAVRGRTLLIFEVTLEFRGEARPCMRAYPFQYVVKREDGAITAVETFTLVIVPEDAPSASRWCAPVPCF
jgi:hypothetical protein